MTCQVEAFGISGGFEDTSTEFQVHNTVGEVTDKSGWGFDMPGGLRTHQKGLRTQQEDLMTHNKGLMAHQ